MSRWCLDISGTWIEVVNYLEKLLLKKKVDLEILWISSNTILLERYT